jgi:hypothetical protein
LISDGAAITCSSNLCQQIQYQIHIPSIVTPLIRDNIITVQMELSNKVEELHGQLNKCICLIYQTINFLIMARNVK